MTSPVIGFRRNPDTSREQRAENGNKLSAQQNARVMERRDENPRARHNAAIRRACSLTSLGEHDTERLQNKSFNLRDFLGEAGISNSPSPSTKLGRCTDFFACRGDSSEAPKSRFCVSALPRRDPRRDPGFELVGEDRLDATEPSEANDGDELRPKMSDETPPGGWMTLNIVNKREVGDVSGLDETCNDSTKKVEHYSADSSDVKYESKKHGNSRHFNK